MKNLLLLSFFSAALFSSEIILKHREYNGVGYDSGYTTAQAFLLNDKERNFTPFLDARAHLLDSGNYAANIGGGMRYAFNQYSYAFGANFYYDFRDDGPLKVNQLGPGLEFLSSTADIRLNGYIPLKTSKYKSSQTRFIRFEGHEAIVRNSLRAALPTIEGEIGKRFASTSSNFDLYTALGSYHLFSRTVDRTSFGRAWGGKARAFLEYRDHFFAEVFATYDHVFRWTVQGMIGFNLLSKPKNLPRFVSQPVIRNEIIPIQKKTQIAPLIDPQTHDPFFFMFVNNTSGSNGTIEDPFPTLVQAQNASKPGDIIYVFPGDGTTMGYDAGIRLKDFQRLHGASFPLTLVGATIPAQSKKMPTITNLAGSGVTLADNSIVTGVTIDGASVYGVTDGGVAKNFTVQDCIISDSGEFGIDATGNLATTLSLRGVKSILRNTLLGNGVLGSGQDSAMGVLVAPGKDFSGSAVFIEDNKIDGQGVTTAGIICGVFENSSVTITRNSCKGLSTGEIFIDRVNIGSKAPVIDISNNKLHSPSIYGIGMFPIIGITPLTGNSQLTISNNSLKNHTFLDTYVKVDTSSVAIFNDNRIASGVGAIFDVTAPASQFCLSMKHNTNTGTYTLSNATGDPTKFQVQAPNASLSGLSSVNTGTFTIPSPITFVLPGTACP